MAPKPQPAKRSGWAIALVAVPLLLVEYVLSVGPAYRIVRRIDSYDDWEAATNKLDSFYSPIWWTAARWRPLHDAVIWAGGFQKMRPPPILPPTSNTLPNN